MPHGAVRERSLRSQWSYKGRTNVPNVPGGSAERAEDQGVPSIRRHVDGS